MGGICYRDIFNCIIQSRIPQISVKDIQISLPYEEVLRSFTFQHNHPIFKEKSFNLNTRGGKE